MTLILRLLKKEFPRLEEQKSQAREPTINFNELIHSGVLPIGTELIWTRRVQRETHTATVAYNAIKTADGKLHKSPSGAARHVNNGKPVDGWKVWKIKETGVLIDTLRTKNDESLGN